MTSLSRSSIHQTSMKTKMLFLTTIFAYIGAVNALSSLSVRQTTVTSSIDWNPIETPYPIALRDNVSFTYSSALNGTVNVPDPYHWFEDGNTSKDAIKEFQNAQKTLMETYLTKSQNELDLIKDSYVKVDNFPWISLRKPIGSPENISYVYRVLPEVENGHGTYYLASQEEMEQIVAQNFTTYLGEEILDTGLVGENRTAYSVQFSPDGSKMLYTTGNRYTYENQTLYVRDVFPFLLNSTVKENVEGGEGHYPNDVIHDNISYSIWHPDGQSFFYSQNSKDDASKKSIRYHVLGTNIKDDIVISSPLEENSTSYRFDLSDDLKYIWVSVFFNHTTNNNFYAASLDHAIMNSTSLNWLPITTDHSAYHEWVTNNGTKFYFYTSTDGDYDSGKFIMAQLDFSKGKAVGSFNDLAESNLDDATVVIPEKEAQMSTYQAFDTNKLIVAYSFNDFPEFFIYDLSTGQELQHFVPEIPFLPEYFRAHPSGQDLFLFAQLPFSPQLYYHFKYTRSDNTVELRLFYQTKSDYLYPDEFTIEQKWVTSKDGTKVPIFLVYSKNIQLDGSHPAMIQFDGEFGQTALTYLNDRLIPIVHDYNVVLVIAGPRGGADVGGNV